MLSIVHKKIAVVLTLSLVIILTACGGGGGNSGSGGNSGVDSTAPQVLSHSTHVDINSAITATFSEALNPDTITKTSFTLTQQGINTTAVMGTVSYSGTTATFTPDAKLAYASTYVATLTTTVQDLAGNGLVNNFSWSVFTGPAPDTTAPTIVSTNPIQDASRTGPLVAISVTFSETMNVNTLISNFTLTGPNGDIAGSVSYRGFTATFQPTNLLDTKANYTATVTTAVQDMAGHGLASNYSWSFATGPWTQLLGTTTLDYATSVATDKNANVYVAGYTYGGLDGNVSVGNFDLFVVKYDRGGVKQWTRQLGTTKLETAYGVATDTNGNVYVTGYTTGDLDGNINVAGYDSYIVKYDSRGVKQWTRQNVVSASTNHTASGVSTSIATDLNDNVYVAGYLAGDLAGFTSAGLNDLFVVKYDSSGAKLWTQQLGTATNDYARGVTTDSSGNVYVTGTTADGLDGNTGAGGDDLFVVKYDSAGVKQWTQQLGTTLDEAVKGIASDAKGNVYVTGSTKGGLDGNTNVGSDDLFVVKYDSAGVRQWTRQLGSIDSDIAKSVATDAGDNVYVTGNTLGGLDGNTGTGRSELFVVKYDSTGVKQWTQQLGTSALVYAIGEAITTDANSNVYVAGWAIGDLDGISNAGINDLFVIKYDSAGQMK
ncbi:MAG: SBBP repeat-containing protein [Gammaproteobacteria bacterium]|nr:SBBP repeat-containing protein [Gammaproteobacteria bacterium]